MQHACRHLDRTHRCFVKRAWAILLCLFGMLALSGGFTPSRAQTAPSPPSAPTFSSIAQTSVVATAPTLPANATSLTLQRKFSWEMETSYAVVATGLAGGSATTASGLNGGNSYAFRYLAVGSGGSTPGTAAIVTTLPPPPTPVTLNAPTLGMGMGMGFSVNLSWTQGGGMYFASYKIYRATQPGVTTASTLVSTITYSNSTFAMDSPTVLTPPGQTYYYRVFVFDNQGQNAGSNEQSILVVNNPPVPVTLSAITQSTNYFTGLPKADLSWTQNNENDFASYKIYRATQPGVTTASTLVATITSKTMTAYGDGPAAPPPPGQTYHYRVFVTDAAGQTTGSNEESTTLVNNPPTAVTLAPITQVAPSGGGMPGGMPGMGSVYPGAGLSWTQNTERDFASYKIYRATQPSVTTANTLVATITTASSVSYNDYPPVAPPPGTTYYYRVFVTDGIGQITGSNEQSTTLVNAPPAAVTLNAITIVVPSGGGLPGGFPGMGSIYPRAGLSWTQSNESDFASYKIYRATQPNVTTASTLVTTITTKGTLSYTDNPAVPTPPGQTYYYRVFVVDSAGQSTGSNEENVTLVNNPPAAVTLAPITQIAPSGGGLPGGFPGMGSMYPGAKLSWTQSAEADFASYKIYRATQPSVTTTSTLVATITTASTLSYNDYAPVSPPPGTTYYYRVFVTDQAGQATGSNEQSTTLVDDPPAAVTLNAITILAPSGGGMMPGMGSIYPRASLSWTQNSDVDFASYKIYRATQPGVTTASTLVTTIASKTTLAYIDNPAVLPPPGQTYYYRVFVFDQSGQSVGSNENSVTLVDDPPAAVTLSPPVQSVDPMFGGLRMTLNWTQSSDADFASYKVYRATQPGVTTASTLLTTITSKWTLSYLDPTTALTPNATYYYRVFVFDLGGQSTGSNEESVMFQGVPNAPGSITLSDVQATSLNATLPGAPLPAGATSLSIQRKISRAADNTWMTISTGHQAGATVLINNLLPDLDYDFRTVAVGVGGSTLGTKAQVVTAPPVPGGPTFSNVTAESVTVTAPQPPPRDTTVYPYGPPTYTLTLQRKMTTQPDSDYIDVATDLPVSNPNSPNFYSPYRAVTEAVGLQGDTDYSFRYVSVGSYGASNGAIAPMSTVVQLAWSSGGPIECGGIRWPQPGSNATLDIGTRGRLSAFLATDWDAYVVSAGGVASKTFTYSDPCSYTWTVNGGSFENGINTGQSVVWIAPSLPGTYTVRLTVDDQNTDNKPPSQAGSRDDALRGYNDAPLTFQMTVTVQ